MRNPFQTNARAAWLALSAGALVLYTTVPVRLETLHDVTEYSTWLEVLLFVPSLPSSLFLLLFMNELGYDPGSHSILNRFMLLASFSVLGFFQWFCLIPFLFGRRRLTTLNLCAAVGGRAQETDAPALPSASSGEVGTQTTPISPFDERGLTPVERVIRDGE